jgi:transposase
MCGTLSDRVHSAYQRRLADLPWQGRIVEIRVRARRFRCAIADCPRAIFTERLPEVVRPKGRRTLRMARAQLDIGLALGGEPGSRLAHRLAMPVSGDTLLRLIRTATVDPPEPPRVIGVDEWAWRRGLRYGTIICDLERNRTIDLLPDRSADSLADWLRRHPGVEMVARDRAGVYADGVRQGAPEATQVADRWHLLRNLGDALRAAAGRHRGAIRQSARAVAATIPAQEPSGEPAIAGTRLGRLRHANRRHREERYEEIRRLRDQGIPPKVIAPTLGMSRRSVERWLAAGGAPDHARPPMPTLLDRFEGYLEHRWATGCQNAGQLHRELTSQGCTASFQTVARWASQRRVREPAREPTPAALAEASAHARWKPPSVRRCAWLLTQPDEQLKPEERAFIAHLSASAPDLSRAAMLAGAFATMVRERAAETLDSWLMSAEASELRSFAAGLRRDDAAVRAALTEPWSTSPVEGQINRLKALKRQMYGRAKYDLLRSRVLAAA